MNKLNILNDSSFKADDRNEENHEINSSDNINEKVLCNHCGRTDSNGVRCIGICVADNEY